jgi:hypothetical protein
LLHIPPEVLQELAAKMKRPEGTITFRFFYIGLFDPSLGDVRLMEIVTGGYLFRLDRDSDLNLTYTHAAPGTGTRIASMDITPLRACENLALAFTWSPDNINLHLLDADNPRRMLSASGTAATKRFQVGRHGMILEVGDVGVSTHGVSFYSNGKTVIQPPAIEAWRDTLKAVRVLLSGSSPEGYMYEVVTANLSISVLVTGYETYCKRRFLELEEEGLEPNLDALFSMCLTREEKSRRERREPLEVEQQAEAEGATVTKYLVESRRLDFQDFARCKKAYNKAYGITFGTALGLTSQELEELRSFIKARHRIVHVTPLSPLIFEPGKLEEEGMNDRVQRAIKSFDNFVGRLHSASLKLRPSS